MKNDWEKAYRGLVDSLHVSDESKDRMTEQLKKQLHPEIGGTTMKRFTAKKTAVLAAVCVMIFGVTAFASGTFHTILGASSAAPDWTSFSDLPKAEQKAGFTIDAQEELNGGFTFTGVNVVKNKALDEDGRAAGSWMSLDLTYEDAEGHKISLSTEPEELVVGDDSENAQEVRTIGDITVYYNEDEYLLVAGREDVTAEELQREATDPHFFISEGGEDVSQRETCIYRFVSFVKDGNYYSLFSDDGVDAETLFAMAEGLIEK